MSKPAFNPNKPFKAAAEEKPAFDATKPFEAVKNPEDARVKSTALESGVRGAVQGATLGFGDEIFGRMRAWGDELTGQTKLPVEENYKQIRDDQRQKNALASKDNPKSYLGGNLAGSVATAFVPGMGAIKGASVAKTAIQGAAIGGLAGGGLSEANPFESPKSLKEFATDVGTGAAIGGVLSGAGAAAAKGIKKLAPESLRAYAEKRALTAAGFMAKDIKKLSPKQQQEIGRHLLNEKVVTAFASLDDVIERSSAGKDAAGGAIGNALQTVDDHVKELVSGIDSGKFLNGASNEQKAIAKKYVTDNFQFNMQNVGKRIRDELIAPNSDNPLVKNELSRLASLSEDFGSKNAKSLGFGNIIKSTQGKQTRFQSETVPEEFKQDVYRIIKEELEDAVGRTGNLESGISKLSSMSKAKSGSRLIGDGSPEAIDIAKRNSQALGDYKNAKDLYGAMKAAQKASSDRLGQTNVNRTVSLTDYIAGGAGMVSGGPAPAVALGALNKLARKYGASTQAISADKLANGIQAVQEVTTDQLAKAIGSMVSKSPTLAKRVGGTIAKAATEGKSSLVAVHYALMKDPEYRKAVDGGNEAKPNVFERRMNQK